MDDVRRLEPGEQRGPALQAAADYLVEQKFDLRALMKAILQSNAYQRSSRPLAGNRQRALASIRATIRGG